MDDHRHLVDPLVAGPSGSELTTILLEVMRQRSTSTSAAAVLARMDRDRFTRTAVAAPPVLRRVESVLASALPAGTEELCLAPLAPFGTHHAVAGVDQHRVVSTIRGSEVAADPTVVLAMEAATRRRRLLAEDPRSAVMVSLAAFQRVTRAQRFQGPSSFAHFAVSGLVTAGRDTGNEQFEALALEMHTAHMVDGLRRLGVDRIEILVSDFTGGRLGQAVTGLADRWPDDDVHVMAFPDRTRARGYYTDLALEVHVVVDGERMEVGDGGTTDWTQRLVASRKERLFISGLGVERLALAVGRRP